MTRPTASTITDDQLDELYARLERAETALQGVRDAASLGAALYAVAVHDGLATNQPAGEAA